MPSVAITMISAVFHSDFKSFIFSLDATSTIQNGMTKVLTIPARPDVMQISVGTIPVYINTRNTITATFANSEG